MVLRSNPKGIVSTSPRLARSAYLGCVLEMDATPTALWRGRPNVRRGGGEESACGWCKDRWGISWQITPRVLMDARAAGGAEAKRVIAAMMDMGKIDIAKIEAARRG